MLGSIYHPSRSTSVKRCQHYVARGGSTAFIFKHCGILQTASLANKIQQVRLKSVKKRQKDSWIRKTHSFISLSQSHTLPSPASRVHQGASVCAPSVGLDLSLATHILSLSLSLSMLGWWSLPWALQRQGHSKALRIHWGQHGSSTPCEWIQRCPGTFNIKRTILACLKTNLPKSLPCT